MTPPDAGGQIFDSQQLAPNSSIVRLAPGTIIPACSNDFISSLSKPFAEFEQAAFLLIFSRYTHVSRRRGQTHEYTRMLELERDDNRKGLPGGRVDRKDYKGSKTFLETLIKAVMRESFQEAGIRFNGGPYRKKKGTLLTSNNIVPISSFANLHSGKCTHWLAVEVTNDEFDAAYSNAPKAPGFHRESTGVSMPYISVWRDKSGMTDFNKGIIAAFGHERPPTGRMHLFCAVMQLDLIDRKDRPIVVRHLLARYPELIPLQP